MQCLNAFELLAKPGIPLRFAAQRGMAALRHGTPVHHGGRLSRSISILFLIALACAAGGCARAQHGAFAVRSATLDHGELAAQLDWRPNAMLLDALDHGIPLDFEIRLDALAPAWWGGQHRLARTRWHRELRYFPLTRQYQLRDPDPASRIEARHFTSRALLIAAICDLHLDLPATWPGADASRFGLRVDLQRERLPGALRLPALLDADWGLSTGNYAWPAPHAAG